MNAVTFQQPRKLSLDEILSKQNLERGLEPTPLETELLIKRIKDGGYSGQFLADAFISSYRTSTPFNQSLGGIIKLDAEAQRLFHQILNIRMIPGWNEHVLYETELSIKAIFIGGKK